MQLSKIIIARIIPLLFLMFGSSYAMYKDDRNTLQNTIALTEIIATITSALVLLY